MLIFIYRKKFLFFFFFINLTFLCKKCYETRRNKILIFKNKIISYVFSYKSECRHKNDLS